MAEDLATRYGRAIAEIGRAEDASQRLSDELLEFARAVDTTPELRDRLTDPAIALEARSAAVEALLQRAHPATRSVVQMLLAADRVRHISEIADAAVRISAEARGASVAVVRTAKPLSDAQRQSLSQALAARAGGPVEMKVVVDESLLGGVSVQMGDTVIDGSVAKRLTELRSQLASV